MKRYSLILSAAFAMGALIGTQACSSAPKSPDVEGPIRDSLKTAGLKDVSVSQDREKGVVTLKGSVASEDEKAHAASIAQSLAAGQVVGNEVAVLPVGNESTAKAVVSDLDAGIAKNLDAALLKAHMHDQVKYDVKVAVVTLTGEVSSQSLRTRAAKVASDVPNVTQVVNKLDVKGQKATSN